MRLVARARAYQHPAPDPRADRGERGRHRPAHPGVQLGQGRLRQGGGRGLGRPGHRLRTRPDRGPPRPRPRRRQHVNWQLCTYERDGTTSLAVLRADGSLAGPPELKRWPTMMELLADWDQAEPVLRGLEVTGAPPVEHDKLLAPLHWPRKVLCAGVNYRRHMRERGGALPERGWPPFFFHKPPTAPIGDPAEPIVDRAPDRSRLDWEAELAVVI